MSEHSKLPPSSAARRMACPGSRRMEELYPRKESDASREGTLAHEEAARCLRTGKTPENPDVKLYVDFVNKKRNGNWLFIESKLEMPRIHSLCWGTPDVFFIDRKNETEDIHLFDFKYGFVSVEVFENWQLLCYMSGILKNVKNIKNIKLNFYVIQPRDYHNQIKHWEISLEEFYKYEEKLRMSSELSMQENAPLIPSEQCTYCSARAFCKPLKQTVTERIKNMNTSDDLDDHELGTELKELHDTQTLLEARITALEEETLAKLKLGKNIPFYKLGRSQPREKWVKPIQEVLTLGKLFDVDLSKPQDAITPKQAIKAGVPADIIREYSETPLGEFKLERIKESETRKIFGWKK